MYTIGHSNHSIEYFISLLKKYNVNCVVDVRSIPYSKHCPHFNMAKLETELNNNSIAYISMARELGARRSDLISYTSGCVDFKKVEKEDLYQKGIERLLDGISQDFIIVLMCTEKDPIDCHRTILVGKTLSDIGIEVQNILANGNLESQKEIEKRLVELYYPKETYEINFNSLVNHAYKKKNQQIGFKI